MTRTAARLTYSQSSKSGKIVGGERIAAYEGLISRILHVRVMPCFFEIRFLGNWFLDDGCE